MNLRLAHRTAPNHLPFGGPGISHKRTTAEWVYFIHAPREDSAATMTEEEDRVWAEHFERLKRLLAKGTLILAGPTLGRINTGLAIIEAPNEATARRIMEEDPTIARGLATGELRGFKVALLRGRD
ncbi:MAG TPA: YciI family protein [Terriglobales bacterium]|nr:YciI family protein [Terriglobales bacterium]